MLHLGPEAYLGAVSGVTRPDTSACVHQAWVHLGGDQVIRAWVKAYGPRPDGGESRELINEMVGHHLATAWSLPRPEHAGTLILPRELCPGLPIWSRYTSDCTSLPAWWSAHVEAKSVKARFNLPDLVARGSLHEKAVLAARDELRAAPAVPVLVAFDEIVANIDRNLGNLLGPVGSRYLAIDHGQCLTGPTWRPDQLVATARFRNVLREFIEWENLPLAQKNAAVAVFDRLQPGLPSALGSLRALLTDIILTTEVDAVLAFIGERARRDTAARRLGLVA